MLTEICQDLRNWFDRYMPKWYGTFEIANHELVLRSDMDLLDGQYYRIVGSALNDGVHQYGQPIQAPYELNDEVFTGAVWAMAVPPAVIALAEDIQEWQDKNGTADSVAMSPFQSESFGGYSYTKSSGASDSGATGAGANTWQRAFANRLNMWRKIL